MYKIIHILLWPLLLAGEARYVCNPPHTKPDGTACNYANGLLQNALDEARPGDTVYLQAGFRYSGSYAFRVNGDPAVPIVVTSSKSDWLPDQYSRISPSHRPNMPVLASPKGNEPSLYGYPDSNGNPPRGWNFIGIAFELDFPTEFDNAIVLTGGSGFGPGNVGGWYIPDAAHTPNAITFDRILVASHYDDSQTTINHMKLNGSNITLKNSFLWPLYAAGVENHSVVFETSPGPLTLKNNFLSAISMPHIGGGSDPDYPGAEPTNVSLTYNYKFRPLKWYMDYWDPVGNSGNGQVCSASDVKALTVTNVDTATGTFTVAGGTFGNLAGVYFTSTGKLPDFDYNTGRVATLKASGNTFQIQFHTYDNSPITIRNAGTGVVTAHSACYKTANPHGEWFQANGRKYGCVKNNFEFKSADNLLSDYEVSENLWIDGACLGQWFGATMTVRQMYWPGRLSGENIYGRSYWFDSLTTNGTDFTIVGNRDTRYPANQWISPGQSLCVVTVPSYRQYDCRTIQTFDQTTKKGKFNTALSGGDVNGATNIGWCSDVSPLLRDVTIRNSVWRNVAGGINVLARDRCNGTPGGDQGRIVRMNMNNILIKDTFPGQAHNVAWRLYDQEYVQTIDPTIGGRDLKFEHITFDWSTKPYNVLYFAADQTPENKLAKVSNFTLRSNIFPDANVQPDGNSYALQGSYASGAYPGNNWAIAEHFVEGVVKITHNQLGDVGCKGTTFMDCTGAKSVRNAAAFLPGTSKLAPGNALSKAGHDGTDIGVNAGLLPLINNLKVAAAAHTAILEFDLTAPIHDAARTQPCVLEVSANEALQSYVATSNAIPYSVIPDLNPVYFKRPDASNRTNPLLLPVVVENGHVSWPIGQNTSVTGDDGASHALALAPSTQYWGRLMCYGDTRDFSFNTAAKDSTTAALAIQVHPSAGVGTIQVSYGKLPPLISFLTAQKGEDGNARLDVPVTPGEHTYTQVTYKDAAGQVTYRGPLQLQLP